MKILIAPLNWGLGHATRCTPIIRKYIQQGDEVVIGGNGESLIWLQRQFPELRTIALAPLEIKYSKRHNQIGAIIKALPRIILSSVQDNKLLKQLLAIEKFDCIISDNRFGMYLPRKESFYKDIHTIYMTHQLTICLPKGFKWLEPVARWLHSCIWNKYDEVWVPDNADIYDSLSGKLGHPSKINPKIKYIGPLSRFQDFKQRSEGKEYTNYDTVAVLSGPEPQRSILEKYIVNTYSGKKTLVIRGKVKEPFVKMQYNNITLVPWLEDAQMVPALLSANTIIARSGYSTIMDFYTLGILRKTLWFPTEGQPEQEYLFQWLIQ